VYANDDGGFDDDGDDGGGGEFDDATWPSASPAAQQLPAIEARFMAMDGPFSATSYFDPKRAAATRGWAGPSHWKFAVVVAPAAAAASGKAKAAPKEKKPKRLLDFTRGAAPAATVFAVPKSAATTLLSKKDREALEEHLLPIDVHFDAHDLYRLFSRPLTVLGVACAFAPAPYVLTRVLAGALGGGAGAAEGAWSRSRVRNLPFTRDECRGRRRRRRRLGSVL